jgi:hypothetical protein
MSYISAWTLSREVSSSAGDSEDGRFTWRRETRKKIYVHFRAEDDVRSNRVIIRP